MRLTLHLVPCHGTPGGRRRVLLGAATWESNASCLLLCICLCYQDKQNATLSSIMLYIGLTLSVCTSAVCTSSSKSLSCILHMKCQVQHRAPCHARRVRHSDRGAGIEAQDCSSSTSPRSRLATIAMQYHTSYAMSSMTKESSLFPSVITKARLSVQATTTGMLVTTNWVGSNCSQCAAAVRDIRTNTKGNGSMCCNAFT